MHKLYKISLYLIFIYVYCPLCLISIPNFYYQNLIFIFFLLLIPISDLHCAQDLKIAKSIAWLCK